MPALAAAKRIGIAVAHVRPSLSLTGCEEVLGGSGMLIATKRVQADIVGILALVGEHMVISLGFPYSSIIKGRVIGLTGQAFPRDQRSFAQPQRLEESVQVQTIGTEKPSLFV